MRFGALFAVTALSSAVFVGGSFASEGDSLGLDLVVRAKLIPDSQTRHQMSVKIERTKAGKQCSWNIAEVKGLESAASLLVGYAPSMTKLDWSGCDEPHGKKLAEASKAIALDASGAVTLRSKTYAGYDPQATYAVLGVHAANNAGSEPLVPATQAIAGVQKAGSGEAKGAKALALSAGVPVIAQKSVVPANAAMKVKELGTKACASGKQSADLHIRAGSFVRLGSGMKPDELGYTAAKPEWTRQCEPMKGRWYRVLDSAGLPVGWVDRKDLAR